MVSEKEKEDIEKEIDILHEGVKNLDYNLSGLLNNEKAVLEKEVERVNGEIKYLGYKLGKLLNNENETIEKKKENLNEEVKSLGYRVTELLSVHSSFGSYDSDPELDDVQSKMKEVEEKKALLERLKKNIDSFLKI